MSPLAPAADDQSVLETAHRHFRAGELEAAWASLSSLKINEQNPTDAPILSLRGMIRRQRGELSEALADAEQVCRLIAHDAIAWYNLGVARERAGLVDDAMAAYGQALELAPQHYASLYNLGTILLLHANRAEESAQLYERAIAICHDDPALLLNLALARVALNQHEAARALMDQLVAAGKGVAAHFCVRGLCHYELGAHEEALRDYDIALTLDPCMKQALYNKGLLLLLQGDYEGGLTLYEAREDMQDLAQVLF